LNHCEIRADGLTVVDGVEVNLRKLFDLVTRLGGTEMVRMPFDHDHVTLVPHSSTRSCAQVTLQGAWNHISQQLGLDGMASSLQVVAPRSFVSIGFRRLPAFAVRARINGQLVALDSITTIGSCCITRNANGLPLP
jgi:hypothetical protein